MQGYRKEQLFHTKRRSGRDRESNPEPPAWQAASLDARPSTTPIGMTITVLGGLSLVNTLVRTLTERNSVVRVVGHDCSALLLSCEGLEGNAH
jgi:hypothetical protein